MTNRKIFINKLADKKVYGNHCEKHKVHYNGTCPECRAEISLENHAKEIKEKNLYIGTRTKEELERKHQERLARNREYYKKRYRENKEFREYAKKKSIEHRKRLDKFLKV